MSITENKMSQYNWSIIITVLNFALIEERKKGDLEIRKKIFHNSILLNQKVLTSSTRPDFLLRKRKAKLQKSIEEQMSHIFVRM